MTPWGPRDLWPVHRWMLRAAVGVLIAAHGTILYYVSSHATVSIAAAAVILVVIKHLGLFGPLLAWFRRRRPPCVE
jgi:membrane protein YdbS with pleckstrin-like domain